MPGQVLPSARFALARHGSPFNVLASHQLGPLDCQSRIAATVYRISTQSRWLRHGKIAYPNGACVLFVLGRAGILKSFQCAGLSPEMDLEKREGFFPLCHPGLIPAKRLCRVFFRLLTLLLSEACGCWATRMADAHPRHLWPLGSA
jgi:hypothetical protein